MSKIGDLADLYEASQYWYGASQHVTEMGQDPGWNFAGTLGDGLAAVKAMVEGGGTRWAGQLAGIAAEAPAGSARAASAAAQSASITSQVEALGTPIIELGLVTLRGMTTASGFGTPDRGQDFGTGADQFDRIDTSLEDTASPSTWSGDGSTAYDGQNTLQQSRAQSLSRTDEAIKAIVESEGADVEDLRGFIDRRATILTLSIPAALAVRPLPVVGLALSVAIEVAAVASTVPTAATRFLQMGTTAVHNAHAVAALATDYDEIGTEQGPATTTGGVEMTTDSAALRHLSTSQDQVAQNAATAAETTAETAWNVGMSHGLVCAPNVSAVTSAIAARTAAAGRVQAASRSLSARLTTAAARYDATDQQQEGRLDGEMPSR